MENNQSEFINFTMDSEVMCISLGNPQLELGNPYVIYLPWEIQDEIFYYPVLDTGTEKVVSVVGLIGTDQGYVYEISNRMVEVLNELDYAHNNWIFYVYDQKLYAENPYRVELLREFAMSGELSAEENKKELEFAALSYEGKLDWISKKIDRFQVFSPVQWESEEEQLNALLGTTLSLYHAMGQYGYNMCWASAAATVINYLQHSVVTGFEVCNRVGIGYDNGGSVFDIQDGLWSYNVMYNQVRNRYLSWDEIIANIDDSKPIVLCANGSGNGRVYGHAAVIYGYSGSGSSSKMNVWDPLGDEDTGDGSETVIQYNEIYRCFTFDGVALAWDKTLSYE